MHFSRSFTMAMLVLLASAASAAEPLTQKCNTRWQAPLIAVRLADDARYAALVALVNDPTRDPEAYARLGQPRSTHAVIERWLALDYDFDLLVDTDEVAQAMASDPVLASRGVISVEPDHIGACFATLPAAGHVTITEYHNRLLDHYFLSSSAGQIFYFLALNHSPMARVALVSSIEIFVTFFLGMIFLRRTESLSASLVVAALLGFAGAVLVIAV